MRLSVHMRAHGGSRRSLKGYSYFQTSPNNVNITIVLSLVYRILHKLSATVWLGALLNASCNHTLSRFATHGGARVSLWSWQAWGRSSWRSAGARLLLYRQLRYDLHCADAVAQHDDAQARNQDAADCTLGGVHPYIKVTCLVFLVAMGINGLLGWLRDGQRQVNIRRMTLVAISVVDAGRHVRSAKADSRGTISMRPWRIPQRLAIYVYGGPEYQGCRWYGGNQHSRETGLSRNTAI